MLYVANPNDNTVTIIDLDRRIPLGEVQVGVEPEGMALSTDGKILVATSETTNMAASLCPGSFSFVSFRIDPIPTRVGSTS
jgi:YVTN family beta-propeller protein